jgi:hypothetical protein
VYAPALVAWVGGPAVVASGNSVGWFPLGPREVFVPAYHASLTYVRNVNITNTRTLNNTYVTNVYQHDSGAQHYMNATPTAVTAVPRSTFTSGQRVSGQVMPLSSSVLAAAAVVGAAPAIVPTRQSVLGADEAQRVAQPPTALLQRPVVARSQPPPAPPPFERQLVALQQKGGRPLTRSELAALQPATPLSPVRVVAGRPPSTVPAGAAARSPGATPTRAPATPSLSERERTLQQSILPSAPPRAIPPPKPAPNASVYAPPAPEPSASAPALRSDRPPTAQQHPASQPTGAADDPTPAVDVTPAAVPVYHFPSAGDAPARPASPAHSGETQRVPPPPPAPNAAPPAPPQPAAHPPPPPAPKAATPAPPPAAHPPPPPPAHTQSSKEEPRDSAAHGDRDSRERAVR